MTTAAFTDLWIKSDTYIDKLTPVQTKRVRELCEKFYNAGVRRDRKAIDRLVAATTAVLDISDRKHDAWDEARAAIAEVIA
jgi:hypothetical protein